MDHDPKEPKETPVWLGVLILLGKIALGIFIAGLLAFGACLALMN